MPDQDSEPELHGLDAGELLARAMQTARPSSGATDWVPPTPEAAAKLLPQYKIESLLGHGGMGAVYKGWQPGLERAVAIKLLPAELAADQGFVARFTREARTLAQLQHLGIVGVHDFGQTPAGHLYFVMEYVEGTDLQKILREPGLKPEQAMTLIGQICDALQYAHSQGVVHRDIKPANILITKDGRAKVADFGLARPSQGSDVNLTQANVVMGTPDYMAPEQRTGHADHRADIFALGVMFYEMLTGYLPRGAFPLPSRQVQVDVRIDEVVLKALQQQPEQRYQQASEMKTDVDHARTPKPAPAPAPRKSLLSRSALSAGTTAAALLLLALAIVLWKGRGQSQPSSVSPGTTTADPVRAATREEPFVNSLGMEFVPVPGTEVLFCTTITTVRDFRAFVKDSGYAAANQSPKLDFATGTTVSGGSWEDPGFPQSDDHPVVFVSFQDAQAFCLWLSNKEHRKYRLTRDHEWSCAAGIGSMEDPTKTPGAKNGKISGIYPWGMQWPPPPETGNFADETFIEQSAGWPNTGPRQADNLLRGYRDGYAATSPVRRFKPNSLGLYDMAGNVCQVCEDYLNPGGREDRTWRGSPWNFGNQGRLQASYRGSQNASRTPDHGFRCVIEMGGSTTEAATSVRPPTLAPVPDRTNQNNAPQPLNVTPPVPSSKTVTAPENATRETPFVNHIGMEFVPVPGTEVLFCTITTRVRDYRTFMQDIGVATSKSGQLFDPSTGKFSNGGSWEELGFPQTEDHPVVNVNLNEAKAFCAWLSAKEGRKYRLPSDHEWSWAVGVGHMEDPTVSPSEKSMKIPDVFPWGSTWPPVEKVGNYADVTFVEQTFQADALKQTVPNYRDGFATIAPVRSFPANHLGLYDMGGNVEQRVDAEFGPDRSNRAHHNVCRGMNWLEGSRGRLLSSYRAAWPGESRSVGIGFRCVVERDSTTATTATTAAPVPPATPASYTTLDTPDLATKQTPPPAPATPAPSAATPVPPVKPAVSTPDLLPRFSQQVPNLNAWALAPLDQSVPADIRQNLTFLREDLADEGSRQPAARANAYKLGTQLCQALLAILDERGQAQAKAGFRGVEANARTGVSSQALEARRNYMMSWPQYSREESQRSELKSQAVNNAAVMAERPKLEWSQRTAQLSPMLDNLYAQFRAALRQAPAAK